eukprot:gene8114-biopygen15139
MGPEVGPAFQRWYRATLKFILGVRLAETGSRHVDSKAIRVFCGILVVGSRTKSVFFLAFRTFAIWHGWEQETCEFRPSRRDPNRRTRALRARK